MIMTNKMYNRKKYLFICYGVSMELCKKMLEENQDTSNGRTDLAAMGLLITVGYGAQMPTV